MSSIDPIGEPREANGLFEAKTEAGIALCLSGGGYRAMLYHTGVLWRLLEAGYLPKLTRVSSVSGGSITSGLLGLRWTQLQAAGWQGAAFINHVVGPIRALAGRTIDVKSVLSGLLWFGTVAERVEAAYREYLFQDSTLQDLPDSPRFVINATSVQSGVLWRFSKPYMRDYRVGEVRNPTVRLAAAVCASSAFPPVLSPATIEIPAGAFTPDSGQDLQREPFTRRAVLTDGGAYDNMGLETASRFSTLFVSDAGAKIAADPKPASNWAGHSYRILSVIDNQVRSLRKRELIAAYVSGRRAGAYWGIRTNIADYGLPTALPCPFDRTLQLAETPTRLKALDSTLQERLINWGYASCDAAMRRHVDPTVLPPLGFPYPKAAI